MAPRKGCVLAATERLWLERALVNWEHGSRHILGRSPTPLPWIVLFDTTCTWHLNPAHRPEFADAVSLGLRIEGRAIPAWSVAHGGSVRLPTGIEMPVQPAAFASVADNVPVPYLVLALPSVFRRDPTIARDSLLEERLLSVVSHEILHTRQLVDLRRQLALLREQGAHLPARLDDNVVESLFGSDSAFRRAFSAEVSLLYRAAFEDNREAARTMARDALRMVEARRRLHFADSVAVYGRLEDLFLNMEGIAEWLRFMLHQRAATFADASEIAAFMRGRGNEWAQDEGLALFLLIERFSVGWMERMLGPDMPAPRLELHRALEAGIPP